MRMTIEHRFWSKVKRKHSGCWEWQAGKTGTGYGQITINKIKISAHRKAWMLKNGDIPNCLFVLHKCDNRLCVNPNHLFLGTHQDNMNDMVMKGRSQLGCVRSEETKIKMSEAMTGRKVIFSEEHKRNLSISARNRKTVRVGFSLSEETRLKISKANKGKKKTDEHKLKIKQSWIIRRANAKAL